MLRMGDVRCTIWWLWIHVPRGRMHCKSHFQALDHIKYAFLQVPFNMLQRQMKAKQFCFFFFFSVSCEGQRSLLTEKARGRGREKSEKEGISANSQAFWFHTHWREKKRQNPPLGHYWCRRCWWFSPLSNDADLQRQTGERAFTTCENYSLLKRKRKTWNFGYVFMRCAN